MRGGRRAKESRGYDEERAALAELGATEEEIEQALAAREPEALEAFELWPENLEAYRLFIALETQWRVAVGMAAAVHLGLDYVAAEAVMRMRRVKDRAVALEDLRAMEAAVLPLLNRREEGEDDG